jgi:hypothetical protein
MISSSRSLSEMVFLMPWLAHWEELDSYFIVIALIFSMSGRLLPTHGDLIPMPPVPELSLFGSGYGTGSTANGISLN